MNIVLMLSILIILIGILGVILNRKNLLLMLMAIELILLGVNILLTIFSVYLDDAFGIVFAIFILGIAGAESAIGLAIIVKYYRIKGTIEIKS